MLTEKQETSRRPRAHVCAMYILYLTSKWTILFPQQTKYEIAFFVVQTQTTITSPEKNKPKKEPTFVFIIDLLLGNAER